MKRSVERLTFGDQTASEDRRQRYRDHISDNLRRDTATIGDPTTPKGQKKRQRLMRKYTTILRATHAHLAELRKQDALDLTKHELVKPLERYASEHNVEPCSVCYDMVVNTSSGQPLTDYAPLPCNHTLCWRCYNQALQYDVRCNHRRGRRHELVQWISCPTCRATHATTVASHRLKSVPANATYGQASTNYLYTPDPADSSSESDSSSDVEILSQAPAPRRIPRPPPPQLSSSDEEMDFLIPTGTTDTEDDDLDGDYESDGTMVDLSRSREAPRRSARVRHIPQRYTFEAHVRVQRNSRRRTRRRRYNEMYSSGRREQTTFIVPP